MPSTVHQVAPWVPSLLLSITGQSFMFPGTHSPLNSWWDKVAGNVHWTAFSLERKLSMGDFYCQDTCLPSYTIYIPVASTVF